ncbi:MAG: Rab family GTPase [Promethearchaeota archaeon]
MKEVPVIKVFFGGEGGVGKSTFVERFVTGIFNEKMIMTIGVNHAVKNMKTSDGRQVILQVWDIGGEERFRFVARKYIRGSTTGVVGFDINRHRSLVNLEDWLAIIREELPTQPIFLVGMKNDIPDALADREFCDKLLNKYHLEELILTSSKTGENVEETFQKLADCLPKGSIEFHVSDES